MKLLAIDTATEACSAALLIDGRVIQQLEVAPRRHGELLLGMVESVLAEGGLGRNQLDGVAFGRGPGAFTGVRIGVAAAQAMGLALDLPLFPVSNLAALAYGAWREAGAERVLVAVDARMNEIYAGAYACESGSARELLPEQVIKPADWHPAAGAWHCVGTGWQAYAGELESMAGVRRLACEAQRLPQAGDIARLAAADCAAGAGVRAELAQPVYLRDDVARKPVAGAG